MSVYVIIHSWGTNSMALNVHLIFKGMLAHLCVEGQQKMLDYEYFILIWIQSHRKNNKK